MRRNKKYTVEIVVLFVLAIIFFVGMINPTWLRPMKLIEAIYKSAGYGK